MFSQAYVAGKEDMNMNPKRRSSGRATDSQDLEKKIRQRAYELYLARGQGDGHDLEDWFLAEEEILQQEVSPKAA